MLFAPARCPIDPPPRQRPPCRGRPAAGQPAVAGARTRRTKSRAQNRRYMLNKRSEENNTVSYPYSACFFEYSNLEYGGIVVIYLV